MLLKPFAILSRILLFLIFGISLFLLYSNNYFYSFIFVSILLIIQLIEMFNAIKNIFQFYDKTIVAILNNDFSVDFTKQKKNQNYSNLHKLYESLKSKQNESFSKEIVFTSILNSIDSSVLILQKDENWNIFLMNDYFSNHFNVPKVTKWNYLKSHVNSLCEVIEKQNFEEFKTTLEIRIDNQDTQTFVIQTSKTQTHNQTYYVILLDSIQKVIDKKEKEAWINLMKIISHELLNSLTPIQSLSQNLKEIVSQESLSEEDLDDIKQSVFTIHNRGEHLQKFVESYRKLASLPTPQKEKILLSELINNSLSVMLPLFKRQNIEIEISISVDKWIWVDKNQMDQVIINLLTNSVNALETISNKWIKIESEIKDNRVFISFLDNGKGIEEEIQDKIFLPFYTTRINGEGIGLTLSKNIVEAHGGYLVYQKNELCTKFLISLLQ